MKFKKLSLALALGSTLVGPAAMAQSSVQIYGRLLPHVINEKGSDATPAGTPVATFAATPAGTNAIGSATGLQSGNSRIGFRGREDLGGGLKAIFQLEGIASVDSGEASLFSQDAYVGLDGGFGSVKMGLKRTIFREYGDTIGVLGISAGTFMSSSDVLRKTGFGTSSASSFHLRRPNSVQYETPVFGGVQAGLMYSTDEAKTAIRNPRVISMGVKYDNAPFYVALAHEIHYDLYGGSRNAPTAMRNNSAADPTRSRDRATQFTIEYQLDKKHKFEFDVIRKEYKENATVTGRFGSYQNMAYLLAMENRWTDKWRTVAQYVKSGAGTCTRVATACVTDGLDGTKFTFVVGYVLSRRTMLFTSFSQLNNGKSARYDNTDLRVGPNPGENIRHVALGLSHTF